MIKEKMEKTIVHKAKNGIKLTIVCKKDKLQNIRSV